MTSAVREEAKAKLLVVDDRLDNLVALEETLRPLGQDLVMAHSGEEALRWLLAEEFAVILLDVQMPGMDGFETAHRIKQREKCRYIPIVFLTAYSLDSEQALQGYSAGAVDYLVRPLDLAIVRSKVAVFVDLHIERKRAERLAAQLSKLDARRRHALELNDTIVQGLAVAKYAFELGEHEQARAAIADTLEAAKRVLGDLLGDDRVDPGDLVREGPARVPTGHAPPIPGHEARRGR